MWVTVHTERSSCPCLCSGVDGKSVSRSVGSWNFQGAFSVKEKYRPCSIAMDFVGWNSGKMNRVCCGAVKIFMENKSSPFCTFLQIGGICDKGYHGLRRASRWFCKIYRDKAVIVGLINPKVDFINKYLYKIPPLRWYVPSFLDTGWKMNN